MLQVWKFRGELLTKESNEDRYTYTNKGAVYEVYEVGKFPNLNIPFVTVGENGKLTLYRLPQWYSSWVDTNLIFKPPANDVFLSKVEFGYIISEERFFAEFL